MPANLWDQPPKTTTVFADSELPVNALLIIKRVVVNTPNKCNYTVGQMRSELALRKDPKKEPQQRANSPAKFVPLLLSAVSSSQPIYTGACMVTASTSALRVFLYAHIPLPKRDIWFCKAIARYYYDNGYDRLPQALYWRWSQWSRRALTAISRTTHQTCPRRDINHFTRRYTDIHSRHDVLYEIDSPKHEAGRRFRG